MQYRREIDGLRAIAVLPVILFHAGLAGFSGGFVGVDVFFVISGYLITALIVGEMQEGRFSLVHFYERRARRILPALFLVMLASLPFAWWLMLPDDMKRFSRSLVAVSLFFSNVMFSRESGYFDTAAQLKPMLHTWSLAIEEQYYLLFPLLLMLVWRIGRGRIAVLLGVVAVASLAYAEYRIGRKPSDVFFLLPYRAWELLVGALCALLLFRHGPSNRTLMEVASLVGIGMIAYAVVGYDESTPFPALHAAVPVAGAALIILFTRPETLVGRLLCSRPFVVVGLISYSAYLWHHPMFAFVRVSGIDPPGTGVLVALSIASLALAYLSWRYVERPFRDAHRIGRRVIFTLALVGSVFFVGIGLLGTASNGYEVHFHTYRLTPEERVNYALIKAQTGGSMYDDMIDDGKCKFWGKTPDEAFAARFEQCAKTGKAIVVLGDSHAMNVFNALARTKAVPFLVGVSQGGCRPTDGTRYCHYDAFATFLDKHKGSVQAIIYHQSGSYLLRDYLGRTDSIEIFAEGKPYSLHQRNIDKLLDYLTELSSHAKVVWLGPSTEARFDFRNFRKVARDGFSIGQRNIDVFESLDKEIKRQLSLAPRPFTYQSMVDAIKVDTGWLKQGDCITYRDADHFSRCGEELVGAALIGPLMQASK